MSNWVSQAAILDCTVLEYDTPLTALVAPNGYKGTRPASASVEDKGMIHKEDRIWQL